MTTHITNAKQGRDAVCGGRRPGSPGGVAMNGKEPAESPVDAQPRAIFQFRSGQKALLRAIGKHRMIGFLARRQYGKTTLFSGIALKKMMKRRHHLVTYGSATLLLGREIIFKEARVFQEAIQRMRLQTVDAKTGKAPDTLTEDDFANLYEQQRLELRVWHDNTSFSRTQIVAPRPDTAVGWTGDVMLDEVGRIPNFREVWEAMEPIVSSDPTYQLLLCTTPPPDDAHFSFEMLGPPVGTEFPVNPAGNWYRSEMGVTVLRVDVHDAYADGVPVYDTDTGKPVTPEQHRAKAFDKDAWDRNYGVRFVFGGTAAVGLIQLDTAMQRGVGQCKFVLVEEDEDLDAALEWLRAHLGDHQVGIGLDLGTTEKGTSNPTAIVVTEQIGTEYRVPLIAAWKTKDPDIARRRVRAVVDTVKTRERGGRARRLCVDATNERYWAADLRKALMAEIPVECVVASETVEKPGEEPMTQKQYLGGLLVGAMDDNKVTLPPERYIKEDFRLVKRDRGTYQTEVSPDGKHGDTFDGMKLGMKALKGKADFAYQSVPKNGKPGGLMPERTRRRTKGVLV